MLLLMFMILIASENRPHIQKKQEKKQRDLENNSLVCNTCINMADFAAKSIIQKTAEETYIFLTEKCPKIDYLNKICRLIDKNAVENIFKNAEEDVNTENICNLINLC